MQFTQSVSTNYAICRCHVIFNKRYGEGEEDEEEEEEEEEEEDDDDGGG